MSQGLPDGDEPDPGRSLMVAALVGIAVLALLTIVALAYVAWRAATDQ